MSEELKACPFCGEPAREIVAEDTHQVRCSRDGCGGASPIFFGPSMVTGAIAAWNRRAPPAPAPALVALVERIKKHRKDQGGYWDDEETDAAIAAAERAMKGGER